MFERNENRGVNGQNVSNVVKIHFLYSNVTIQQPNELPVVLAVECQFANFFCLRLIYLNFNHTFL